MITITVFVEKTIFKPMNYAVYKQGCRHGMACSLSVVTLLVALFKYIIC